MLSQYSGPNIKRLTVTTERGPRFVWRTRSSAPVSISSHRPMVMNSRLKGQIPALTGMRGLAATWVFIYHLGEFIAPYGIPSAEKGWIGVDIFFILSGFIISYIHFDEFKEYNSTTYKHFILLRLIRIYPVHFFMILVYFGFVAALQSIGVPRDAPRFDGDALLGNLALVHAWGGMPWPSWNFPSWSISAEFGAYLFFPVFVATVVRVKTAAGFVLGIVAALGGMTAILVGLGFDRPQVTFDYGLVRVTGCFLAGVFVYRLFCITKISLPWGRLTDAAFLVLLWVLFGWGNDFAASPVVAFIIFGVAKAEGILSYVLTCRPILLLGTMSYSLYMVHMVCLEAVFAPLHYSRLHDYQGPWLVGMALIAVTVTLLATAATYHLVELPSRNILRRRLMPARYR